MLIIVLKKTKHIGKKVGALANLNKLISEQVMTSVFSEPRCVCMTLPSEQSFPSILTLKQILGLLQKPALAKEINNRAPEMTAKRAAKLRLPSRDLPRAQPTKSTPTQHTQTDLAESCEQARCRCLAEALHLREAGTERPQQPQNAQLSH